MKNGDVTSISIKELRNRNAKTGFFGQRPKWLLFMIIAVALIGWFAYTNLSIPSDSVLNKALLRQMAKHKGKSLSLKIKDLYPGSWKRMCFYGTYQGRDEILRDSGIDIQQTRARVWAGGEDAMTFLFIDDDGTISAQRVHGGMDFYSQLPSSHPANAHPSCGNRDSMVGIEALNPKPYLLIFYPGGNKP